MAIQSKYLSGVLKLEQYHATKKEESLIIGRNQIDKGWYCSGRRHVIEEEVADRGGNVVKEEGHYVVSLVVEPRRKWLGFVVS